MANKKIQLLNKQVHLYAMDTSALYTESEREIHDKMQLLLFERAPLKKKKRNKTATTEELRILTELNKEYKSYKTQLKHEILKNNKVRQIRDEDVSLSKEINMFESTLSRVLNIRTDEQTKDLITIKTYFQDVASDAIIDGFIWNGDKFNFYCASSGQMREKTNVFIRESVYEEYMNTLMCGLTPNDINSMGGICINKYIAYSALTTSATELWEDFNIDKCIVVDDFETDIFSEVDYVDWDNDCKITRKWMDITIPHFDGAGIMLPSVFKKNVVMRSPFIKGLLTPFDFISFINEFNGNPVVKDIHGKEWNVIEDGIEIIFTKSQYKMNKYMKWDVYQDNYKKFGCQTGIAGMDVDYFKDKRCNYQMLQTLPCMTDEDLKVLLKDTNEDIAKIGRDIKTSLKLLGVSDSGKHQNKLQECLALYPLLINDWHSRKKLQAKKAEILKKARYGKINVDFKYTYVVPDVFAFGEWLFLGIENPNGLLNANEVHCDLYANGEEIDCLRSPHLYIEHAISTNVRSALISKWMPTKGVYVSVKDNRSTLLFWDCDGDAFFLTNNSIIVKNAKKMNNDYKVVPLAFERKKAKIEQISQTTLRDGLWRAYNDGGGIGENSNLATKAWNQDVITEKTIRLVKIIVVAVNRIIDATKNGDKVQYPDSVKEELDELRNMKVPHFFRYAKDKSKNSVAPINNSLINRISKYVKNTNFKHKHDELGVFDYHVLMKDKDIFLEYESPKNDEQLKYNQLVSDIITTYEKLDLRKYRVLNSYNKNYSNYRAVYLDIEKQISEVCEDSFFVADILVKYLFSVKVRNPDSKNPDKPGNVTKTTFWECYGDIVKYNIEQNLNMQNHDRCIRCHEYFVKNHHNDIYCKNCKPKMKLERNRKNYTKIGTVPITCSVCGNIKYVRADRKKNSLYCSDKCRMKANYERKKRDKKKIQRQNHEK